MMIEKLVDVLGWLRNFISPVLISFIIGVVIYFYFDETMVGIVFGISIVVFGFIAGIFFAEKVRKKIGTHHFNAQNMATPDIKGIKKTKRIKN